MSNNTKEILSNQNVIAVNQGKVKKKTASITLVFSAPIMKYELVRYRASTVRE